MHNEELNRIKESLKEEIAEEKLAIGRINAARKKEQVIPFFPPSRLPFFHVFSPLNHVLGSSSHALSLLLSSLQVPVGRRLEQHVMQRAEVLEQLVAIRGAVEMLENELVGLRGEAQ